MTKNHFYHNGGNLENRHSIVEALVFNFNIQEKAKIKSLSQLELFDESFYYPRVAAV